MYENIIINTFDAIAVITALYWLVVAIDTFTGMRSVMVLHPHKNDTSGRLPKGAIIISAKDEETSIARSLRTIKDLDYPDYEVIVVNDRSTDRTLDKINSLQKDWKTLKVITVDELPDGWLGKNYACYRGYRQSTAEILLFTDADVIFKPGALRTAVAYLENQEADHCAVSPFIFGRSFLLRLFVKYFFFSFLIYFRPWAGGMGVGAFNMFRREAYERIGTHRVVALRPDEDVRLGKLAKKTGLRQRFASGKHLMSVEWYASLREAMQGIEKNAYAGLRYSIIIAAGAVAGQIIFFLFPFVAVMITSGLVQGIYIAALLLMVSVYLRHVAVFSSSKGLDFVFLPLAAVLFIFAVSRALVKTIMNKGIRWRGTFYSLKDLRDL